MFEGEVDKESVEEKEENTDVEDTEKEDNTDVEDDLYPDFSLMDNSDLLARPPKIWISKTASMEHDLDWSSIL